MAQPAVKSSLPEHDTAISGGQDSYVSLLEALKAATQTIAKVPAPVSAAPAPLPTRPAELDHFTRLLIETIRKSERREQKARLAQLIDAPWLTESARLELCALPH